MLRDWLVRAGFETTKSAILKVQGNDEFSTSRDIRWLSTFWLDQARSSLGIRPPAFRWCLILQLQTFCMMCLRGRNRCWQATSHSRGSPINFSSHWGGILGSPSRGGTSGPFQLCESILCPSARFKCLLGSKIGGRRCLQVENAWIFDSQSCNNQRPSQWTAQHMPERSMNNEIADGLFWTWMWTCKSCSARQMRS